MLILNYINFFNLTSGKNINNYFVTTDDYENNKLFFPFYITNTSAIKEKLKEVICNNYKEIIEEVILLQLNITYKKYLYFQNLKKDLIDFSKTEYNKKNSNS